MPQDWEDTVISIKELHTNPKKIMQLKALVRFNLTIGCFALSFYDQQKTKIRTNELLERSLTTTEQTKVSETKDHLSQFLQDLIKLISFRSAFYRSISKKERLSEAKTGYVYGLLVIRLSESGLLDKIPLNFFTLRTNNKASAALTLIGLGSENCQQMDIKKPDENLVVVNASPTRKRPKENKLPIYYCEDKNSYLAFSSSYLQKTAPGDIRTISNVSNRHVIQPRLTTTDYGTYGNRACVDFFNDFIQNQLANAWKDSSYDIFSHQLTTASGITERAEFDRDLQKYIEQTERLWVEHIESSYAKKRYTLPKEEALAELPTIANIQAILKKYHRNLYAETTQMKPK